MPYYVYFYLLKPSLIQSTYWSSLTLLENSIPSADDLETEELRNSMLMTQQEALIKLFAVR